MALANEKICSDMVTANVGKTLDSGLVVFDRQTSHDQDTEVFILYTPLSTSLSQLRDEPFHRTALKRTIMVRMFDHLDDVFIKVQLASHLECRTKIQSIVRQFSDNADVNRYRKQDRLTDPDNRWVQACLAVIDGRFDDYLKHNYPHIATAIK